jgi:hypothetical protein
LIFSTIPVWGFFSGTTCVNGITRRFVSMIQPFNTAGF